MNKHIVLNYIACLLNSIHHERTSLMSELTLILQALSAGATAALQQTAGNAVSDAYRGLKALIERRFIDQPHAQAALTDYEDDPDTYEKPLSKFLRSNQLDQDEDILATARHLLTLVQPQQIGMGKYTIQNTGTVQGQVIGDHAHVKQQFGNPPNE